MLSIAIRIFLTLLWTFNSHFHMCHSSFAKFVYFALCILLYRYTNFYTSSMRQFSPLIFICLSVFCIFSIQVFSCADWKCALKRVDGNAPTGTSCTVSVLFLPNYYFTIAVRYVLQTSIGLQGSFLAVRKRLFGAVLYSCSKKCLDVM